MNFLHKIPLRIFNLFYPLKIVGKENIPQGKAILCANHYSLLDCGYVVTSYNKDIKFLAKKEIFKNKIFGALVKSFGAFPIDREKPEVTTLMAVIKWLKEGHKLAIFPEGTRNKSGTNQIQEIKDGTMVFSLKSHCPIVPIIIYRKARFLRKNYMIIGKPFELEEFYGKKLTSEDVEKTNQILRTKMEEQYALLEEYLSLKKRKKAKKKCK